MIERYSRQILFTPIGVEGQEKLRKSRVLIVGCGALGSVLAEILARGGVGRLVLADRDYVDESNLQRQSLYTESDAREGLPKAVAAAKRLGAINGQVELAPEVVDVNASTVERLFRDTELVLDGTDNFETRYLLNDASLRWKVPWIYGACVGSYGLCLTIVPGKTPCLRCVLERLPPQGSSPTCDTSGVIAPIVHWVASLQSAEALKLLTGNVKQLSRKLITMDVWENRAGTIDLSDQKPDPRCPACGEGRYEFLEGRGRGRPEALCGRNAVQIWKEQSENVEFVPIAERLSKLGPVIYNEYLLRAYVNDYEIALFKDGRSIIKGTADIDEAQRVLAKYIGT